MIAKERDASASIAALEELKSAHPRDADRIETELRKARAGVKAEDDAAYYIDFAFRKAKNYAVIHDLRLEVDGRVAQIDHLVVSRTLKMFVLETKSFRHGLKITGEGEFLRWNDWRKAYEAMESPLHQCDRHIRVLSAALEASGILPRRLGMSLKPSYQGYVLIQPSATLLRPERFDTSRVVKFDAFESRLFADMDAQGTFTALMNAIGQDTLADFAGRIAALHMPIAIDHAARLGLAAAHATAVPLADAQSVPAGASASPEAAEAIPEVAPIPGSPMAKPKCKACEGSELTMLHGRFGYFFKCACGANTSPKLPAGAKLHKDGGRFVLHAADGSETIFHENAPPPARQSVVDASEVPFG